MRRFVIIFTSFILFSNYVSQASDKENKQQIAFINYYQKYETFNSACKNFENTVFSTEVLQKIRTAQRLNYFMLEQRLSEDEVEHLTVFNELLEALYKWYMNFSNYSINFHVKFSRYNTDCTAYAELAVFKASI